mmetsp:Transcript_43484/g.70558  ORF Transcript_43484/g.70558 Transcript_43484/m.70558 type:complete len:386 (+) Transcript_43484:160-1317(+)|eukprot:CAMPEP_0184646432 /NCGR_PEP_ID=MMETSP0308-20130426/3138_1 /TAXON_ID=38269 /ORGANISM="Gloeochaete witrockiana, Strain SAG 46.84" /LENGTH=385 /DNA_ID=CAMNT_0027076447 /DNA_START=76 /DNA_END=1233 /DNA_ORIENTATION=+
MAGRSDGATWQFHETNQLSPSGVTAAFFGPNYTFPNYTFPAEPPYQNASWVITPPQSVPNLSAAIRSEYYDNINKPTVTDRIPDANSRQSSFILSVGGRSEVSISSTSEMFRPVSGCWKPTNLLLNTAREGHTVSLNTAAGRIYVYGGGYRSKGASGPQSFLSSVECLDIASSSSWQCASPLNFARYALSGASVGRCIFAIGGWDGKQVTDTTEYYNCERDTWILLSSMLEPRAGAGAVTVGDVVYVVGGTSKGRPTSDTVQVFDPHYNTWLQGPGMQVPRAQLGCVVYEKRIFAIGGISGEADCGAVEYLDPREGKWRYAASLRTPRRCLQAAQLNEALYVMGGFDGFRYLDDVEVYDFASGKWRRGAPMSEPRGAFAAAVVTI